jgi:hypothetical protein
MTETRNAYRIFCEESANTENIEIEVELKAKGCVGWRMK